MGNIIDSGWINIVDSLPKKEGLYLTYEPSWRVTDGFGNRIWEIPNTYILK